MASNNKRRFIDLLPANMRSEALKKFFGATVDQVFQPGQAETLTGYIGQFPSYYDETKDFYLAEHSYERAFYQLEPTMVGVTDTAIDRILFYPDMVSHIRANGGRVDNHNKLFAADYYSWAPPVDIDKLVNPQQYHWFGDDPTQIPALVLSAELRQTIADGSETVFLLPDAVDGFDEEDEFPVVFVNNLKVTNFVRSGGDAIEFTEAPEEDAVVETYRYGDLVRVIEGRVTFDPRPILNVTATVSINKIREMQMEVTALSSGMRLELDDGLRRVAGWDTVEWDMNQWDELGNQNFIVDGVGSSIRLTIFDDGFRGPVPTYLVMGRSAVNENPWSKNNFWVHRSSFAWSGKVFPDLAGKRPIIEFLHDLELYNYGRTRTTAVDGYVALEGTGWDTTPWDTDMFDQATYVTPLSGIVVAGGVVEAGDRILIPRVVEGRPDLSHVIAVATEALDDEGNDTLVLIPEPQADEGDIVEITGLGIEFHFNGAVWILSQKFTPNVAPLFSLYDLEFERLDDTGVYPGSDFVGNRLFGYAEGTLYDSVLNFNVEYDSLGQFVFENDLKTKSTPTYDGGTIGGMKFYKRLRTSGDIFANDWHLAPSETQQTIDMENFTIPMNLQANPSNEEVEFITRNEWFDHFDTLMTGQDGFEGESFSSNNYRDTAKDMSVGRRILQHRAPMLKTMLMASDKNFDYMDAVRFVEHEYSRFRNRFIQQVTSAVVSGLVDPTADASTYLGTILDLMKVNKTADFPFALSRVGGGQNFIPPTPAVMGILPSTPPQVIFDATYGAYLLRGHDGSRLPLFGERKIVEYDGTSEKIFVLDREPTGPVEVRVNDALLNASQFTLNGRIVEILADIDGERMVAISVIDPRDSAMLELEQLIYENIPESLLEPKVNLDRFILGAFRNTETGYDYWTARSGLMAMFNRWAQINNMDFRANVGFDEYDPFTWNYSTSADRYGRKVPGHWRGIYRYYFDTDRPNTDPWEMLGFASQPDWWEDEYGAAPYTRSNVALWEDLRDGRIASGPREGTDPLYARPDLLSFIPVDESGALLDPVAAQIIPAAPTRQQAKREWAFGDGAPVESLWMNTPAYCFALSRLAYLLKPARWIESNWDTANTTIINDQTVYTPTGHRPRDADLVIHGDEDDTGARVSVDGIQQWIVEHMISKGQSSSTFADAVRGIGVRLGHRMGGFTSKENLRILADNFGLLPQEDINIVLHTSPSAREEFYSGALIEWTGRSWRIIGYNSVDPNFYIIPGDEAGPSMEISLSETPEPIIVEWKPNVYYKTDTLVDYRGSVYSCLRPHMSTAVFEDSFWDARPDIMRPQAARVVNYSLALDDVLAVPYGAEFTTYQEVADVLLGYERWLVSRGWIFDEQDEDGNVRDWTMAVREFLGWAQHNWAAGNFIAVSPGAEKLKFHTDHGTIFAMEEAFNGVYGIVNRVGMPIDARDTFVSRLDGDLELSVRNNDLFGVRLTIGEVEHALIFSNETIFSDVVYKPLFDLRQPRLKIIGEIARDWNGRLDAPGYMIIDNEIKPNFDKSAEDLRTMFDIEAADNKVLRDHARHVIGFEQRSYMEDLMLSDTQQFEFYQGMVQQKGAPGVFEKLLRSQFISQSRNLRFLEEWAFKDGEYGAISSNERVSFDFFQSNIRRNPQLVTFEAGQSTADVVRINGESNNKFIHAPRNAASVFPLRATYQPSPDDLPTAGYVRRSEVGHAFFDLNAMQEAYEASLLQGNFFGQDGRVWLYETENHQFDVKKLVEVGNVRVIPDGDTAKIYFDGAHGLTEEDIGLPILVSGDTECLPDLGGVRVISAVEDDYIEVEMEVSSGIIFGDVGEDDPEDFDLLPQGTSETGPAVFVMRSLRFPTLVKAQDALGWMGEGDFAYVSTSPWVVYERRTGELQEVRRQPYKIDSTKITSSLIYDRETKVTKSQMMPEPLVLDHLLVYDPVVGCISGLAERELAYKVDYDPARYSDGSLWGPDQLGYLWWDISRVRFLEAETDILHTEAELKHRIENWGKVAPGSSIDVYEWTRSTVLPAQWTDGEVYRSDNPSWVEQQEFDAKLGRLTTVYYFWVKNRSEKVRYPGRKLDSQTVADLLENPTANNIPWFAPISPNSLLISGVADYLNDVGTVFQMEVQRRKHDGVLHSEWTLLRPKDERSLPSDRLWTKLVDSVTGIDALDQPVPDPNLHVSMRQGVGIRPRQSLFVGSGSIRTSVLAARESFVSMINIILARTNVSQDRPLLIDAFETNQTIGSHLRWTSEEGSAWQAPPTSSYEITHVVNSIEERNNLLLSPGFRAPGRRVLVNRMGGDIPQWSVWAYRDDLDTYLGDNVARMANADALFSPATTADITVTSIAERDTTTMAVGTRVLVQPSGGFWSLWAKTSGGFDLIRMQNYKLMDFWQPVDWYAEGYSASNPPVIRYATISARNLSENPSPRSKFVRIDDDGTGAWIWTAYDGEQWNVVARQNGTIKLSENFFASDRLAPGEYNLTTIARRDGTYELRTIADIVKTHFTDEEINELFFSMVHFAHSHLDQVSWAFKTSFLYIAGYNEEISQSPVQINDGTESLLSYIEEVKPYRVKTRDFARTLNPAREDVNVFMSDFDKPLYYDEEKQAYRNLKLTSPIDLAIIETQEPWKSWYENHQKPYRVWKRISDPTRGVPVDYDPNYGFEEINPIRRFRTTIKFARISGEITYGGTVFDGSTIVNSTYDLNLEGNTSSDASVVDGNAIINPGDLDRPEELLRVDGRDFITLTIHTDGEDSIKCTAIRPLADIMKPVKISGWEANPWDTDDWDYSTGVLEYLPPVQEEENDPQVDYNYRWKLLPVGTDGERPEHVAKILHSMEGGWQYLRFNDSDQAVLTSVVDNDAQTAEIEIVAGDPNFAVPEADAPGAVMIGNERVTYTGLERSGADVTITGLGRATKWTGRGKKGRRISVGVSDGELVTYRLDDAGTLEGLTVVQVGGLNQSYSRKALELGKDFAALVVGGDVEITLQEAPPEGHSLIIYQTLSGGHEIGSRVLKVAPIEPPQTTAINGDALPDAWVAE